MNPRKTLGVWNSGIPKWLAAGLLMLTLCCTAEQGVSSPSAETAQTAQSVKETPPAESAPAKLIACYFHGTVRCISCLEIERESRQMVFQTFLEPLSLGQLEWRSVNYDNDPGAALAKPFNLSIPSLILILEGADGKILSWKNLEQIWEFSGDPDKLREYAQREITALLSRVQPPATPSH
ncbi:MAG TPA: nitrophenyl compound nitroreductase subunit ArsF family protein [Candidatus Hydrogenedentes bacterium]|mgnify:CR=1 FL=1|nr:nitrophenyl compound nitroreductase subunit ArsF family protein [Candidatus Hydrogenedentota bacterium]HPU96766.1 nitrophenyl compound nitroreductase subunit ArsF family protein [Candidatus Hydrogenedentota bacterium]